MDRPFTVRYSADVPGGLLECRLLPAGSAGAGAALAVHSAMHRFLELANAGALAGGEWTPDLCGIGELLLREVDGGLLATFRDVRIDGRSLSVLVNLVHAVHERELPLRELHVGWAALGHLADPAALDFPSANACPPFSWTEDEDLGAAFDIVIDFAVPQDGRGLRLAVARTAAWLTAVAAGAYGDEGSPPQVQGVDFAMEPATWSPESLVWYLDRFASGAQALDGLRNVLVRLHADGVRLATVEVSE